MKKTGLISLLVQLKNRNEEELKPLTALEIIELLVTYINDPQIKAAVDDIPF